MELIHRYKWLLRLALVGVSLLLCFLILEIGLRLFTTENRVVYEGELVGFDFNERLIEVTPYGRRLRPNRNIEIINHPISQRNVSLRTNEIGLRGGPLKTNSTDPRILVLGDSITLADYAPEDQTIPAWIERGLRASGRGAEVLNAGIGGINLDNEVGLFIEINRPVEPDLVVVCLYLNDGSGVFYAEPLRGWGHHSRLLRLLHAEYQEHRFGELIDQQEGLTSGAIFDLVNNHGEVYQRLLRAGPEEAPAAFDELRRLNRIDWGNAWSPEMWQMVKAQLERLRAEMSGETKLALVLFPVAYQFHPGVDDTYPQKKFRRLMDEMQVPALDLYPIIGEAIAEHGREIYLDHCHLSDQGNAIVGRAIAEFLIERGLLDEESGTGLKQGIDERRRAGTGQDDQ